MNIRVSLNRSLRQTVIERLLRVYQSGQVRLVRRIRALLFVIDGQPVDEVAALLDLGRRLYVIM